MVGKMGRGFGRVGCGWRAEEGMAMCLVRWGMWGEDKYAADIMYTNKVRSQAFSPWYLIIVIVPRQKSVFS